MANKVSAASPFIQVGSQRQAWARLRKSNSVRGSTTPVSHITAVFSIHLSFTYSGFLVLVNLAAGTALYLSTPRASFLAGRFVFSNWDMEQLEGLKEKIVNENLLISRIRFGDQLGSAVIPPNECDTA